MKKSRILLALISLIIIASLLSGCTGAGTATTTSWPGLTLDPEAGVGYVAHGSHVYAINLLNGSQTWRFPNEPVRNSTFDAPPAIQQHLYRERVQMMFSLENARRKRIQIVAILNRHGLLKHDRPAVKLSRDQVNRCASPLHAMLPGLILRICACKGREQ